MNLPASWNPWHGCTKISAGCKYCYVYRQDEMYGADVSSSEVRKTGNFNLPVKRKRDKSYKIGSGTLVYTCFTSDFFVDGADEWRSEIEHNVPFCFHQTGAKLLKDGKLYRIKRYYQISQAWKAGINYRIGRDGKPLVNS